MGFKKEFTFLRISEWKESYFCYKKALLAITIKEREVDHCNQSEYQILENELVEYLRSQLVIVESFYDSCIGKSTTNLADYDQKCQELFVYASDKSINVIHLKESKNWNVKPTSEKKIKAAFERMALLLSEEYIYLLKLQRYKVLNIEAFYQIAKKIEKRLLSKCGHDFVKNELENSKLCFNDDIDALFKELEKLYANCICNGDKTVAMKKLACKTIEDVSFDPIIYFVGFLSSYSILAVIIVILRLNTTTPQEFSSIGIMFRGMITLCYFLILYSFDIYLWDRCGINRVIIFLVNPRKHMDFKQFLLVSLLLMAVVLTFFGLYTYNDVLLWPPYLFPYISFVILLLLVVNPIPFMYRSGRFWFLRCLGRNILAGFFKVIFPDFFLGDQLNSVYVSLVDLGFMIFHIEKVLTNAKPFYDNPVYAIKYVIMAYPAYIRAAQCFRRFHTTGKLVHAFNGGKYLSFIAVCIVLGIYDFYKINAKNHVPSLYALIFFRIVSTFYMMYWDIFVDWGLFTYNCVPAKLRECRVYSLKYNYHVAIVFDIITRNLWILGLVNEEHPYFSSYYLTFILNMIELTRRFVWNIYRVENEHISNVGEFRIVRDISITPISKIL